MLSPTRPSSFNVPLNGYRGLCALLVFVYHVANAGVIPMDAFGARAEFALSSLRYGVELFFMISGFVITGSLLRHTTHGAFLRDRFIRIYSAWAPLLILVCLVCGTLHLKMFADTTTTETLGLFVANFFLLPPLIPVPLVHAVSWSLTYEWVFYLAASVGAVVLRPPAGAVGVRVPRSIVPIVLWGLTVALFIGLFPRALFFVTGVIVFTYRERFERHARWLRFPALTLVMFLIAWRFTGADKAELTDTMFDWALDGRWLPALIAFAASLHMFAGVTLGVGRQFAFLETPTFQFLGKVSYSFYLWHFLVVSAVKRVVSTLIIPHTSPMLGFIALLLIALVVSVPVAWASWLVLEVRLAKIMRAVISPAPAELPRSRPV